jgi:hypothetical protein
MCAHIAGVDEPVVVRVTQIAREHALAVAIEGDARDDDAVLGHCRSDAGRGHRPPKILSKGCARPVAGSAGQAHARREAAAFTRAIGRHA